MARASVSIVEAGVYPNTVVAKVDRVPHNTVLERSIFAVGGIVM
jgi:hypothetical protein